MTFVDVVFTEIFCSHNYCPIVKNNNHTAILSMRVFVGSFPPTISYCKIKTVNSDYIGLRARQMFLIYNHLKERAKQIL